MEVHLSAELQAKVERAAAENRSGAEEYVKQLVEHYVDHDAWFRQQVTRGLEQLDRGEFLTHEEVGARIDPKPPQNVLDLPMGERALMAFQVAVRKMLEERAREGASVSIMRDGEVVSVPARELLEKSESKSNE
jgi:predicted transcriptional regulator